MDLRPWIVWDKVLFEKGSSCGGYLLQFIIIDLLRCVIVQTEYIW